MITLEVFRQLTKFTYILKRMRLDDEMRGTQTIDKVHVRSGDVKWMGWDDQTRGIQTIDQVHIHSGDG